MFLYGLSFSTVYPFVSNISFTTSSLFGNRVSISQQGSGKSSYSNAETYTGKLIPQAKAPASTTPIIAFLTRENIIIPPKFIFKLGTLFNKCRSNKLTNA